MLRGWDRIKLNKWDLFHKLVVTCGRLGPPQGWGDSSRPSPDLLDLPMLQTRAGSERCCGQRRPVAVVEVTDR